MKMKEDIKSVLPIIIATACIVSILTIKSSFIMAIQGKKVLNVNSRNRDIIAQKITDECGNRNIIRGTIEKVEYRQLLGDWSVYIYYTDWPEEEIAFDDTEGYSIREYIDENGYDEGKIGAIRLLISLIIILISICYGIRKFIKQESIKQAEEEKIKVQVEKESDELKRFIRKLDR